MGNPKCTKEMDSLTLTLLTSLFDLCELTDVMGAASDCGLV